MKLIYILVLIFHVFDVICVSLKSIVVPTEPPEGGYNQMQATIYRTVNKYFCSAYNMSGVHLLMYGTHAWTFPRQDVNLTLRYPRSNLDDEDREYLITGFQVNLRMDSQGSEGFITDGGVLQDTITLSFTSSNITMMRYQFWVYGVNKFTSIIPTKVMRLCQ